VLTDCFSVTRPSTTPGHVLSGTLIQPRDRHGVCRHSPRRIVSVRPPASPSARGSDRAGASSVRDLFEFPVTPAVRQELLHLAQRRRADQGQHFAQVMGLASRFRCAVAAGRAELPVGNTRMLRCAVRIAGRFPRVRSQSAGHDCRLGLSDQPWCLAMGTCELWPLAQPARSVLPDQDAIDAPDV